MFWHAATRRPWPTSCPGRPLPRRAATLRRSARRHNSTTQRSQRLRIVAENHRSACSRRAWRPRLNWPAQFWMRSGVARVHQLSRLRRSFCCRLPPTLSGNGTHPPTAPLNHRSTSRGRGCASAISTESRHFRPPRRTAPREMIDAKRQPIHRSRVRSARPDAGGPGIMALQPDGTGRGGDLKLSLDWQSSTPGPGGYARQQGSGLAPPTRWIAKLQAHCPRLSLRRANHPVRHATASEIPATLQAASNLMDAGRSGGISRRNDAPERAARLG